MAFGERRNMLDMAMQKQRVDLHLRCFLDWVFNVTDGGIHGHLQRSHSQLSYSPRGLCCSVSKVRTTVDKAVKQGFVIKIDGEYTTGGQSGTKYKIDWEGVRSILGFSPPAGSAQTPEAIAEQSNTVEEIAQLLQSAGVERFKPVASELHRSGVDVATVASAVDVMRYNEAKLSKPPGALVLFLRTGSWPASVVPVPPKPTAEQREAAASAKRVERAVWKRDDILFHDRKFSIERDAKLRSALPPDLHYLLEGFLEGVPSQDRGVPQES